MFLKKAIIVNIGPIAELVLELPFTQGGSPKPVILVGANGSGKTNVLSIVTDALFEGAVHHYKDVIRESTNNIRPWFRVVGGITTRIGQSGCFGVLEFEYESEKLYYGQKSGEYLAAVAQASLSDEVIAQLNLSNDGNYKSFEMSDDLSKKVYETGVYAFFPSSRSEVPEWLNADSLRDVEFEAKIRFEQTLGRPIFVNSGLHSVKQWILSIILEARVDFREVNVLGNLSYTIGPVYPDAIIAKKYLMAANKIISKIIGDGQYRFIYTGNNSPDRLALIKGDELKLSGLVGLSGGQSTLLSIFGTLLKYAHSISSDGDLKKIAGICIVDEIDAHMHVDLQYRALPELMAMFPNVQFIVSSHSPIFALGMAKTYGDEGIEIREMPSGHRVVVEEYAEFGRAFMAFTNTSAHNKLVLEEAKKFSGKPIILTEGRSDAKILKTAWEKLYPAKDLPFEFIPCGREADEQKRTGGAKPLQSSLEFLAPITNSAALAIFDHDGEGSDCFKGLNKSFAIQGDDLHKRFDGKNVHAILLQTPPGREAYSIASKSQFKLLAIEHYFSDDILKANGFNLQPIVDGANVFDISNGPKTKFSENTANLDAEAFVNFGALFDRIRQILGI